MHYVKSELKENVSKWREECISYVKCVKQLHVTGLKWESDTVTYTYVKVGSSWSVFKKSNDDLKTSSCTLLRKIGNKSFPKLVPVYEIDLKPHVVVNIFWL